MSVDVVHTFDPSGFLAASVMLELQAFVAVWDLISIC